jgi:hypothetical protein
MSTVDCPYFDRDYKKCSFFGTAQEGSQRESYCLSGSNWKNCVNYTNRSYDEKLQKKIRTNPDL